MNDDTNLWHELIESFFLSIANHLPRWRCCDRHRYRLLKLAGVHFNGRAQVWAPVEIRPIGRARGIRIGAGTFINSGVRLVCYPPATIHIGADARIGPRVMFETVTHGLKADAQGQRGIEAKSIVVEDRVWIGAGAIILPGITIGHDAVVGAGAVVTKDVAAHTLVAGVPAVMRRNLADEPMGRPMNEPRDEPLRDTEVDHG